MNDVGPLSPLIRRGSVSDAMAIASVHGRARAAYYRAGGVAAPAYPDNREDWWALKLSDENTSISVVESQERILGFVSMGWEFPGGVRYEFHLFGLYVDTPFWALGLGSLLHDVFEDTLAAAKAPQAVLEVWDRNARALEFYSRKGWEADGRSREMDSGERYLTLVRRIHGETPVGSVDD